MDEYKSNSNKARATAPVVKSEEPVQRRAVVDTPATIRKKSLGEKFGDVFFKTDGKDLKGYILSDIVVPSIKDMISDVVRNGIDYLLYGDSRGGRRTASGKPYGTASYVNYASLSKGSGTRVSERNSDRLSCSCDEVIFTTEKYGNMARVKADEAMDMLLDIMQQEDKVRLADYYSVCGLASQYTDRDWGWTDLSSMEVRKVREGWLLKMPRMVSLK